MFTNTPNRRCIAPPNSWCEFCDEFSGGLRNSFASLYHGEIADRVVFETPHLRVVPTLGQIVPGYLLLIPTGHYRTLADLPVALLGDLDELRALVQRKLHCVYGDYLFFEHGARRDGAGGCGIYHAHLHAVPFPAVNDPVDQLKKIFPYHEVSALVELQQLEEDASYLYYGDIAGGQYIFRTQHLPSQYMRRLLAQAIGCANWDWRQCGMEESFFTTRTEVSTRLASLATPR